MGGSLTPLPTTTHGSNHRECSPRVGLGEDNDYIYREVLGLSEQEYDHLKALGHIGTDYLPHVR